MTTEAFAGVFYYKSSEGVPKVVFGESTDRLLISAIQQAVARVALLNPDVPKLTEYALRVNQAVQEFAEANPVNKEATAAETDIKTEKKQGVGDYL